MATRHPDFSPGLEGPKQGGLARKLRELAGLKPPSEGFPMERFSRLEKIGEGRMSNVYRAEDKISGRQVALKVSNGMQHSRIALRNEERILSRLNHPAIGA